MLNDQEAVCNAIETNEDDDLAQIIDAALPTTSSNNDNEEGNNTYLSSSSVNNPAKHSWFILEPAVFLVFLSMYLSSKFYTKILVIF